MDQQRLGAVPGADEGEQLAHMRFGRQHLARLRFDDVGDADVEMALGGESPPAAPPACRD